MRRSLRVVCVAAALVAGTTLAIRANATSDAELQFQLASLLFEETRYREAVDAFERATQTDDPALEVRARKGKVRSALRIAEFDLARTEAEGLRKQAPGDAEALSLHGDALWSFGLFDEADRAYSDAVRLEPGSSRARFGRARTLAALNKLDESLDLALAASAAAPRDGEIHSLVGDLYRRLNRYDQAANAYTSYINLLPNKDRSEKAAWARAQVEFLESFEGVVPAEMDESDLEGLHTLPFKLVKDKIIVQARVNGSRPQDFVLDTGSEETVISRETAQRERIRPVTYTLSAGVGEVGLRGLQLSRLRSLDLGTLQVRNASADSAAGPFTITFSTSAGETHLDSHVGRDAAAAACEMPMLFERVARRFTAAIRGDSGAASPDISSGVAVADLTDRIRQCAAPGSRRGNVSEDQCSVE